MNSFPLVCEVCGTQVGTVDKETPPERSGMICEACIEAARQEAENPELDQTILEKIRAYFGSWFS